MNMRKATIAPRQLKFFDTVCSFVFSSVPEGFCRSTEANYLHSAFNIPAMDPRETFTLIFGAISTVTAFSFIPVIFP